MVPSPLFLSPSDDLHGPPFQRLSASAIEYIDSYEENKKRKGAKIQSFSAVFALCAKTAQQIKACAVHRAQSFALRSL